MPTPLPLPLPPPQKNPNTRTWWSAHQGSIRSHHFQSLKAPAAFCGICSMTSQRHYLQFPKRRICTFSRIIITLAKYTFTNDIFIYTQQNKNYQTKYKSLSKIPRFVINLSVWLGAKCSPSGHFHTLWKFNEKFAFPPPPPPTLWHSLSTSCQSPPLSSASLLFPMQDRVPDSYTQSSGSTSIILVVRTFISLTVDCGQPLKSIMVRILHSIRTPGASGLDKISLATARLREAWTLLTCNYKIKYS